MSKSKRPSNKPVLAQLRIVGGKHRGRKLPIPAIEGLRPTPDRIRETLFNWLQFDLADMNVVDCFAGTGALGLEALSRGAERCDFVEPSMQAANSIQASLTTLKETNAQVHKVKAAQYLQSVSSPVDLIFIDPPFALNLWQETLEIIETRELLTAKGFLYIETPKSQILDLSPHWQTVKDKTAGNLRIRLVQQVNNIS
ncbi:16S rRNA (guanine(966)-N(2))-methyltransferase RsmD [Reinekea forsetii]|nr:16S rRNA (guanine(966)-N(2))-methyltransferase RsmD [Reinekea forsetii]